MESMGKGERANPEITATFNAIGGIACKKNDLGNSLRELNYQQHRPAYTGLESGGQPDYTVLLPPLGFYVEGKAGVDHYTRLPFDKFEPDQRAWLSAFPEIAYVWIWLGEEPPHLPGGREAYLVDWPRWLALEQSIGRLSLPFEGEQSARKLLPEYQLEWAGDDTWRILNTHPFWAQRVDAARFFYQQCERLYKQGVPYGADVANRYRNFTRAQTRARRERRERERAGADVALLVL